MTLLDVSQEIDEALVDVRAQLVTALRTIPDLFVTDDPWAARPPCCLVGLPRVTRVKVMASTVQVQVELPINLIAPQPANSATVAWLLSRTLKIMRISRADDATPARDTDTGEPLPAYTLIVNKALTITEDGS